MKAWRIFIFLITFSSGSVAQDTVRKYCDIFGPLHFKNGVASVKIKALCLDLLEDAPIYYVKGLSRKHSKAYSQYYNYFSGPGHSGAAIALVTNNCDQENYASLAKLSKFRNGYVGKVLTLNCLVFEKTPSGLYPRNFGVSEVTFDEKDNKPPASIKPLVYFQEDSYDDNVSLFSNDVNALITKTKAIVAVNEKAEAELKTIDGKTLKFKKERHTDTQNGYLDHFIGEDGWFDLIITRVIKTNGGYYSEQWGQLRLELKNVKMTVDVFGEVKEIH